MQGKSAMTGTESTEMAVAVNVKYKKILIVVMVFENFSKMKNVMTAITRTMMAAIRNVKYNLSGNVLKLTANLNAYY